MMSNIQAIERNIHGYWVIYGALGIRQYGGYTKDEAVRKYNDEVKRMLAFNQPAAKE